MTTIIKTEIEREKFMDDLGRLLPKAASYNKGFAIVGRNCKVQRLFFGSTLCIILKFCASIAPPSQSPETLSLSVKSQSHKQHIWFFANTKANAKKNKRAVFCQRTDRKTNFERKI